MKKLLVIPAMTLMMCHVDVVCAQENEKSAVVDYRSLISIVNTNEQVNDETTDPLSGSKSNNIMVIEGREVEVDQHGNQSLAVPAIKKEEQGFEEPEK